MRRVLGILLVVLASTSLAQQELTDFYFLNLTDLIPEEDRPVVELRSLIYPPGGVVLGESLSLIGNVSLPLTDIVCTGPSACACARVLDTEFSCVVSPPVRGTYRLTLQSAQGSGSYLLELFEGVPVQVTTFQQRAPPDGLPVYYAVGAIIVLVGAYGLFFGFRRVTRTRREVKDMRKDLARLDRELKELHIRFMKRELDSTTYRELVAQKEGDRQSVRDAIQRRHRKR
ncbi:hypothetical protein KJ765_01985 [Candidatus Micrarchaeota archaeon]|nr:hypothetical protein [Candidatus Micrarchaeota archaeon]